MEVVVDGRSYSAVVSLGSIGNIIPLSAQSLIAREEPYPVYCAASVGSRRYISHSELLYLPGKNDGSVVKLDRRTGGTLVQVGGGRWDSIIPFGWYDVSM